MFRNYIKVALRNMWKQKGFSAINVFGLALGLATCLLITLFVQDELSYDKYNEKAARIFRVNADIKFGGDLQKLAVAPDPMAATLVREYPQIEAAVRFRNYGSSLVKKGTQNIKEERIIYTDSSLFEVFTLPMIAGNSKKALAEPNTVVVTESMARKYFGKTDAIGQILQFDNKHNYTVTGVIKEVPENSHFNFDFFVSLAGVGEAKRNVWVSFNFNTYLLFRNPADAARFEKTGEELFAKYIMPQAQEIMKITPENFKTSGNYIHFSLTPLSDIHLQSDRIAELGPNANMQVVYIFSAVAFFILLIACVNFMNLSTARSANRAKEVGVRKALGTQRKNLVVQFLTESVLTALLSLVLALLVAWLLLPFLNELSGKALNLSFIKHPFLLPLLFALVLIVGLLAGTYPALYLSAFNPVEVLKGKLAGGFRPSYLRSSLVVFQFFISIALIVATIVIYSQLKFIQAQSVGFNREQVLVIKDAYALGKSAEAFKAEVLRSPQVLSGSRSGFLPVQPASRNSESLFPNGQMDNEKAVTSQYWQVDHDYIKTLGMQVVQGRDFDKSFATDSNAVIINEAAIPLFGFGANPIGQKITELESMEAKTTKDYTVIGVVKNFNYESLRQNIGALCMKLSPDNTAISFRFQSKDAAAVIKQVQDIWKKMVPSEPFSYSFLNEDFDRMYRSEQRSGKIFLAFAVFAIFIACLGLLGLVTYAAEQRIKEIGIRKVLGASVSNIVAMLAGNFLKLVLIACMLALPLAWWLMNKWLQDFAYRIQLNWWMFAVAILASVVIALLTVSVQAVKAATMNPVKNLRSE